jgi:hypothetical protein
MKKTGVFPLFQKKANQATAASETSSLQVQSIPEPNQTDSDSFHAVEAKPLQVEKPAFPLFAKKKEKEKPPRQESPPINQDTGIGRLP